MLLTNLIAADEDALEGSDRDITGITADSRRVEPGFLFVAIPGAAHDGRDFIPDAIARGALAVLVPEESAEARLRWGGAKLDIHELVSIVTTRDVRKAVSGIAARYYPRQPANIAAVTGTSGKTSTAQFTREIWQALGRKSASIGTLGFVTAQEARYGSLTTPDAITLHRLLDEAAGAGITHLALEASSHGLAMNRLDHAHIKAAAFTNLSRDHLDFHGNMEDYLQTKLRLFSQVLGTDGTAVLNADTQEFEMIAGLARNRGQKCLSFGRNGRELKLLEARLDISGQILHCEIFGKRHEISLPVLGSFQAWNALCALGLAIACGEDPEQALPALARVTGVPGRLQLAGHTKDGAAVFVDYAHKPDALENVLTAIRPHVRGKLGVVVGCGGNRDKGKRPVMGQIARRLADWVIVTDDNPRNEDPALIRKEILAGAATGPDLREIGDRAEAIAAGIQRLQNGDVLIIAGKGHESGQIVGDKTLPFDDAEVARRVLEL
ncbi:MAG: UDP-N-acetylmuramoyl-L-alanyl-D-glutamate--2,6-diaminopimelate ligase [Bdellovibrionales bacterium]